MGKTATHALVFAQLYTPDGECHGMHNFVVPLRDTVTLEPYPGITVGDMGRKIALNAIPNGYVGFVNLFYFVSIFCCLATQLELG